MSPEYLSPGVYVEEVDKGTKPIEGVGTAMAAFVGFAEKGPVNQPTFIPNWTEYVNTFGGFIKGVYLAPAVYGYFQNGGGRCYVTRLPGGEEEAEEPKAVAMLTSGAQPSIDSLSITALEAGAPGSEITVEVSKPSGEDVPDDQFNLTVRRGTTEEVFENLSFSKAKGAKNVVDVVNRQSKLIQVAEKESSLSMVEKVPGVGRYSLALGEAQTIALAPVSTDVVVGDAAERSGLSGFEVADEVTMLCVPDIWALYKAGAISMDGVKAVQLAMIAHCENMKDRFAILDCPPGLSPQEIKDWRMTETGYDTKYGALYYPWISVANPLGNGESMDIPPSGYMAGIYARSDTERGVHKAPANEVVRGALAVETQITKSEQDILNPIGVNCIRSFPGRGIRVWGARTLSSDASWRYINVRRLFNFVEKSIERGTQWIVFEPNDMDLWARIRRDVKAFLTTVWRSGALFGATPAQAFYVKCDEENNTPDLRDLGQVIIEIGMAPVKPAEFVIFRISQWASGSDTSE
ncbi:MAG: phage tail sheath family protein [Dehalococcoidales bacterium]|nr:MAG: phage tail sheath family protein [Dehalococcoidales bacterium]